MSWHRPDLLASIDEDGLDALWAGLSRLVQDYPERELAALRLAVPQSYDRFLPLRRELPTPGFSYVTGDDVVRERLRRTASAQARNK